MSIAPTTYRVHARTVGGGEATVTAAESTIPVDTGWQTPPTGRPGPAELLGSAFAGCLMKNLARTRALIGFEYDDAEVDVTIERQEQPPRFVSVRYSVRVSTDEPERRLELMHANLRKFGTVYNTLAAVCDVQGTVEAVPPR